MDNFNTGELFSIRNQFYTNQHTKVVSYNLDSFAKDNQLKVLEYQIRLTIALSKDASELIKTAKTLFPSSEYIFQLFEAFDDLKQFGTDNSTYFEDVKIPTFEAQACLTALYLVKFENDYPSAIKLLNDYTLIHKNQLEPFLILIQLYLINNQFDKAKKVFTSLSTSDDIIYEVISSWISSISGQSENISSSYYFYDELLSSDFDEDNFLKFKILNVLFVLTLQLKHIPESNELLKQILQLNIKNPDFIANQITYDYLVNNGQNVPLLVSELKSLNPNHQLVLDLNEKEKLFDSVIRKYQEKA